MKDDFAEAREEDPRRPAESEIPREPGGPVSIARGILAKVLRTRIEFDKVREFVAPALRALCAAGRALRRAFKKDSVPNLVLVMVLLSAGAAAAVGITHEITEPRITEAREQEAMAAMETVFPGEDLRFQRSALGDNIYEARDGEGRLAGFSIYVSPRGYAGPVHMIVGINLAREMTGVTVVSHRELGSLAEVKARGIEEALALFDGEVRQ